MALAIGQSTKGYAFGTTVTTGGITTQASGSSLIVVQAYSNSTGSSPYSSFADSKGNTWTQLGTEQQTDISNQWARVWYCASATGGAGHTFTSTITVSRDNSLRVVEVTTAGLGTAVDAPIVQAGIAAGDPFITPAYSTASATALLLCALDTTSGNSGATHSFDNSVSVISNTEETDGTSKLVGVIGQRSLAALFGPTQVTCTEAGTPGRGSIFMVALKEVIASTLLGPRMMTGWGK